MKAQERAGAGAAPAPPNPPASSTPPTQMQTVNQTPTEGQEKSLLLFGKSSMADLPAAVQQVMQKYKTQEIPGVAQTWKPAKVGDTIGGVIRKYREGVGQYNSSLVVLEGDYGFRTVWLGADLKQKVSGEMVGSPVMISYEGKADIGKKQPMNVYRVIEILEATG